MRCKRCGYQPSEEDNFCAECGHLLKDPHVDQRILLALAAVRDGRQKEARQELVRLLEGDENNSLANHLLGTLYFKQGTLDLAIECYQKALDTSPEFILGAYDLGVAWYHRGNMLEAIKAFRQCLEIDSHYNAAHYRLGVALYHAGELTLAMEHFEQCTTLTPEYLMARYHIGVVHERLGDKESAAREFNRSSEGVVGEVSSLYHLARIRKSEGNDAESDELMKRVREFGKALQSSGGV